MSKRVRQAICLICLLVCGLFCTRAAAAGEVIDTKALGTLTVSCTFGTDADAQNNLALAGVVFRLYRVAGISADGTYTITSEFADSGVTDSQLNSLEHAQDMTEIIERLASWMGGNASDTGTAETASGQESTQIRVSACQEAVTDESGTAVFENLQTGLYLLTGEDLIEGEVLYSNSSALVSIPSASSTGTGWEYTILVNAKAEATTISAEPESDTEAVTEASTESSTEAETEASTESSTEAETEASMENSTEAETEALTENSTEAETEPSTEGSTEAETELPTENSTKPPTENSAEESTEEPITESPTESEMEYSTNTATGEAQTESPSESSSEAAATDAVQTGDTTTIMAWLLVMMGACGVFTASLWFRRARQMRL